MIIDVVIKAASDWYPEPSELDAPTRVKSQRRLTDVLIDLLKHVVTDAFTQDGFRTKPEHVLLEVARLQNYHLATVDSVDNPDVLIVVRPMWHEALMHAQESILESMNRLIAQRLQEQLQLGDRLPWLRLELEYKRGGGIRVRPDGEILAQWTS